MPDTKLFLHDDGNRITEVTLFSDRAQVRREASGQVGQGLVRLLLEVRAFEVDRDTLQARVFGEGRMLGVQYREIPAQDAPQDEVRALDERKRQLQQERQRLLNAREGVDKQKQFLDSTLSYAEVQVPREIKTVFPDVEQLGGMLDFLDRRYAGLAERRERLELQLQDLERELAVVERKLRKGRRSQEATLKAVEVLFDSAVEQTLRVAVDYGVGRAGWTPQYRVEVDAALSRVSLDQFARITQLSGESWEAVGLTVSNAAPTTGAALPRPRAWRLSKRVPQPLGGAATRSVAFAAAPGGVEDAALEAVEEPPAPYAAADRRETAIAFEYGMPGPVDIPASGDETLLPLGTRLLDGEFFHHTVPRLDPRCYLVCRVPGDRELLPGPVNVHFDGRHVASTRLGEDEAGAPLLFNLGVDRAVLVKREVVTDKTAETYFGVVDRNQVARELAYLILLENRRQQPVRVELYEGVPVASIDRYQVKGVTLEPEPGHRDWDAQPGLMRWDLELAAGASRQLRLGFSVKYPRDDRPDGL